MLKNPLQISYWTIGGFEGGKPFAQALEEAAKMGYDGVELCFGDGSFKPGVTEKQCKEYKAIAKSLGIGIHSLCSGWYWQNPLSATQASTRKKAVEFTKAYLQAAKWIGAKVVLVIPGAVAVPWDDSMPVVPYATVWKNATASIRACVPTAKKLGVTMGLENVWNWFLNDPIAMKTFIDQFKTKRVGAYFDVANHVINGYPEHWIEILGNRIAGVHFKNFKRDDCGGTLHGFGDDIMTGDVNWTAVVKALKAVKYTGPITAEMIPFSRLPDLVLPDMKLAKDTAPKMKKIAGGRCPA